VPSSADRPANATITFALVPGIAIHLTVLSVNVVGNSLRDALDPRLGRR
jgi:ABC-type dipeptide/oligopeptide/nickel transport system permease subunit